MMSRIVIVGAGERGRVVAYYCVLLELEVLGFLDDTMSIGEKINGIPILGGLDLYQKNEFDNAVAFHVAIGDSVARTKISRQLQDGGKSLASIIHPSSEVARPTMVGDGIYIAPQSIVFVNVKIGDYVAIGSHVSIGADARIGTGVSISAGCVLTRASEVGENTFLGASTTIIPEKKVGDDCIIGAGSTVIRDIPDNSTAVGSPCRVIRTNA